MRTSRHRARHAAHHEHQPPPARTGAGPRHRLRSAGGSDPSSGGRRVVPRDQRSGHLAVRPRRSGRDIRPGSREVKARILARTGAAGCALVLCGAGWAAFAPAASAVSGVQSGFWSALPATPQVPAGGLDVAANANGPQAVAAVKFTLADGETAPILTLKVAQAQPQSQVAIEACAIATESAGWAPPPGGGPGPMASAPKANCTDGLVTGALSADGSTVTFDLSLMPTDGTTVNILIQPSQVPSPAAGTAPGAPNYMYPTFDAAFKPVDASAVAVTAGPSSSSGAQAPSDPSAAGGVAYPAPAPAPAGQPVALPPATTTDSAVGGVAPVVASPQPSNVAAAAPAVLTKSRNWRLLFGIALASSDLLFLLMWVDRRLPETDKPLISIYDPPPLAT